MDHHVVFLFEIGPLASALGEKIMAAVADFGPELVATHAAIEAVKARVADLEAKVLAAVKPEDLDPVLADVKSVRAEVEAIVAPPAA